MVCPKCGKQLEDNARFCTKCGYKLDVAEPKEDITVETKKPFVWKENYTFYAIGAAVLIAAIAGFVVKMQKSDGHKNADLITNEASEYGVTTDKSQDEHIEEKTSSGSTTYTVTTSNYEIENVDVESAVLDIREQYNTIVEQINAGNYDIKKGYNSETFYLENGQLKAMTVPGYVSTDGYAKSFFYDNEGDLCFAYYESYDANRLYFVNNSLIRWRYSEDASDPQNADNHDKEVDNSVFLDWERVVLHDNAHFAYALLVGDYYKEDGEVYSGNQSDYILPYSDSRYLEKRDLYGLTADECRLARNELYARHGRLFDDESLQSYFDSKSWYYGWIEPKDFDENMLNDYEFYNRDLIVEYEKEKGYR